MNRRRPSVGLATAREMARRKAPYLSSVIYSLVPIASESVATMALSKDFALYYNKAYIDQVTNEVACHHFWHIVQHAVEVLIRQDTALHGPVFNLASCLVYNERAKQAGLITFKEPKLVVPADFGLTPGQNIAAYYQGLLGTPWHDKLDPLGGAGLTQGQCWLAPELENTVPPEIVRSDYSWAAVKHELATAISEWATRGRGSLPGGLLDWALVQLKQATVPWDRVLSTRLRGTVSSALRRDDNDSTYSRPHRRSFLNPADRLVHPGEAGVVAEVVLILDTSGSMGHEQVGVACREMRGVLMSLGLSEVTLIHADADVQRVETLSLQTLDLGKFQVVGRGGTDFSAALQKARELRAKAVVYITDGEGALPPTPPPYALIWLLVNASASLKMPYGYVVRAE